MKFDYEIVWYALAEEKLLNQARYVLTQSQNVIIAENFYDSIKSEVEKLSFTADVYRLRNKKFIFNGKNGLNSVVFQFVFFVYFMLFRVKNRQFYVQIW